MSGLVAQTDYADAQAQPGWSAELNCSFEPGPQRSIVRRTHTGPLYMQRPFYPEGSRAHVYLLHPPGGVVAGDHLRIKINCIDGAKGLVSTPGATKFYRSESDVARVDQRLVCENGSLEWLPAENIFYFGSQANLSTTLHLKGEATVAWWEINCLNERSCFNELNGGKPSGGKPGDDEPQPQGDIASIVEVYFDEKLTLRERWVVNEQYPMSMSCGMRDNRVSGAMLFAPLQSHSVDFARKIIKHRPGFNATFFDSMLLLRYLGDSSEDAKAGFTQVWSGLRTTLNKSKPQTPRIWAT